jgi:hypothetical protein
MSWRRVAGRLEHDATLADIGTRIWRTAQRPPIRRRLISAAA